MDSPDSSAEELGGRWMTLAEIAAIRGISEASASRLVRRNKWRRQPDNRGVVRTLVPPGWEMWSDRTPDVQSALDSPDSPDQISHAISVLHEAVAALREQLERAEAGREAERARADAAEQARAAHRLEADALRERLQGLLSQLATAEAEAKAANDRAWVSGEAAGALREELAALGRRVEAEQARADRAESGAAHEQQDFLDAESRAQRELDAMRQRLDQAEQGRELAERAVEQARQLAQEAQDTADALRQSDAARRAGSLLARFRAVWRGA
jgi:chromosome segregation ATPase